MSEKEKLVSETTVSRKERKILACANTFKLSQKHDISLKEIGDTRNRHSIKIAACQLGCFN